MAYRLPFALACLLALPTLATADPATPGGSSGYINTPNATVRPEGEVDLSWSNFIDADQVDAFGAMDRYTVSAGILPWVEVNGQVNYSDPPPGGRYIRDLAFGAKLQLPGIPAHWPQLAVGVEDFGGAAPNFRTRYLVSSWDIGPVQASLGYGHGRDRLRRQAFGGTRITLPAGFALLAEHDTESRNFGLNWVSPAWRGVVRAQVTVSRSFAEESHNWVTAGLRFDLDAPRRSRAARYPDAAHLQQSTAAAAPDEASVLLETWAAPRFAVDQPSNEAARPLADTAHLRSALERAGFTRVTMAVDGDRRLNLLLEAPHRWNNLADAVGIALGLIAEDMNCDLTQIDLALTRQHVPLVRMQVPPDLLSNHFGQGSCSSPDTQDWAIQLHRHAAPGLRKQAAAAGFWAGRRIDLSVYPALRFLLATDIGDFDHSAALAADLRLPMWSGATLNTIAYSHPDESADYDNNGSANRFGLQGGLQAVLLHQTLATGHQGIVMGSIGQFSRQFRGAQITGRWSPGAGRHQFEGSFGWMQHIGSAEPYRQFHGAYTLAWPARGIATRLSYEQFAFEDSGATLEVFRDFDDLRLSGYLRETDIRSIGFRVTLPLPALRASLGPVDVRLAERWRTGVGSVIKNGTNPVLPNGGRRTRVEHRLSRVFANGDRWSAAYLHAQLPRMIEAYRQYRAGHPPN